MKKEFNRNDFAAIKRAAASIAPLAAKRDKLLKKRDALNAQIDSIQRAISSFNVPIKEMTGYGADDLIVKDGNGKFVFRFPDTIIPPEINFEVMDDTAAVMDDTAVVDEVETSPAGAPFNPLN
nr:MAG TPA: hypothetical protein [Bacteriophage sp.]